MKIKVILEEDFLLFCRSIKKYWPAEPDAKEIDAMNWPRSVEVEVKKKPVHKTGLKKVYSKPITISLEKPIVN